MAERPDFALDERREHGGGEVETREDRIAREGPRWGVLAAEMRLGDKELEVDIEVPGMDPEDFHINVVNDALVVHGEKRVERERIVKPRAGKAARLRR